MNVRVRRGRNCQKSTVVSGHSGRTARLRTQLQIRSLAEIPDTDPNFGRDPRYRSELWPRSQIQIRTLDEIPDTDPNFGRDPRYRSDLLRAMAAGFVSDGERAQASELELHVMDLRLQLVQSRTLSTRTR